MPTIPPFTPPAFLQGQDVDTIHRRMMAAMPEDIDKAELSIPWDFTRPAATEKAMFIEYELTETVKLIFPHWAYAQWLDLHAELEGITRRAANRAFGYLTVIGRVGHEIEQGFLFATPANLTPSIIFETTEAVTIGNGTYTIYDTAAPAQAVIRLDQKAPHNTPLAISIQPTDDPESPDTSQLTIFDGTNALEVFNFPSAEGTDQVNALMGIAAASTIFTLTKLADSNLPLQTINRASIGTTVPVQAIEGGVSGNVPPDSIILMVRPDSHIAFVKNEAATTGGAPEETDDDLRIRVLEMIRRGLSWTGNDSDYVRWAMEVPGVGNAVTQAEWAGPGTVRVFVIDANGLPANQQILDAVYDWIIRPGNRTERKAPIGASLTVAAPAPMYIDISAKVNLREGEDLATVTERFEVRLADYWLEASTENDLYDVFIGKAQNYVKYVQVGARLAKTPGVKDYDYTTFTVNGGTANLLIEPGTFPVTGEVNLYE